ncbi:zinc-dependent metalloprotease [Luteimonas panaciterrae]|uniref:zinc-dependent metalloprotease n=1 Tax=Luteimonas panaciterrae TaxID=363885 RepID=UPI001CF93568|nr:zinc-dependent metalloprotease [Luteimonas panaciterrae]
MQRSFRIAAGLTGLALAGSAAAAGKPLFVASPAGKAADVRNERALENLFSHPSTLDVRVTSVDASASDNDQIELVLGGRVLTADRSRSERTARGDTVWYGHVRETAAKRVLTARETSADPLNDVVLVRHGNQITGNARVGGKLFRIRPLPDGTTAVVEVDESRMPAEHPDQAYREILDAAKPAADKKGGLVTPTAIDPGATATIRVLVVATQAAINAYGGDMQALAELAVAESNQGYANSNVGINMVLAGYSTVNYSEVGMSTDLSRFRGTSDGYMDGIHTTRNDVAADVAVLIGNDSSACGLASGIGSTASTAFATAYWDCATGYYSFAHEIGHLQSARHDPATDSSTSPYSYGHGYRHPQSQWRTIMAYNCSSNCPRLNYWSNPDKTYNGAPMGTATQSHNQRVLVNTKATVAGYR